MSAELWVKTDGDVDGPFAVKVIRQKIRDGEIAGDDLLSRDRRKWQSVARVMKHDAAQRIGPSEPNAASAASSDKPETIPLANNGVVDAAPRQEETQERSGRVDSRRSSTLEVRVLFPF